MNDLLIMPHHIAVIMDGNRRWARAHGLPVLMGHKKVADEILEPLVEYAAKIGVKYMTFWAFSTENWNRAEEEVKGIMEILRRSIGVFGDKMHKKGVKLRVIGDLSRFDEDLQKRIAEVVEKTKENKQITVALALNYGGRDELLRAIHNLQIYKSTNPTNKKTTEEEFEKYLDTAGMPDPELVVRTGGEQRMSGFLPWQSVYSEYYFPSWFMPEFTSEKLDEVVEEFNQRKRRFGK